MLTHSAISPSHRIIFVFQCIVFPSLGFQSDVPGSFVSQPQGKHRPRRVPDWIGGESGGVKLGARSAGLESRDP